MIQPNKRRHPNGFTLIEVMVVLVIITVLATGISFSLDSIGNREEARAIEHLRLVLEASAERAEIRGQSVAIEFLSDGYRFNVRQTDEQWLELNEPPIFKEELFPDKLRVQQVILGNAKDKNASRITFGNRPPLYSIVLQSVHGQQILQGLPSGEVRLLDVEAG